MLDNIVWGTLADCADNIVWGTFQDGDNIVWGTLADADNIVWGTDCGGADCDNIVWGTFSDVRQHRLGHGGRSATTSSGVRRRLMTTTCVGDLRDEEPVALRGSESRAG